jgi:hypothetical protein
MGATSAEGSDSSIDENGIVKGHAYSILRVVEVSHFSSPSISLLDFL